MHLTAPEHGTDAARARVLPWVALVAVYVLWGSTYLAIRVAVETIPPMLMAGTRYLAAGAILYPLARRRSGARPTARQWRGALIIGIFLLVGGNGGVTWAEQAIESGLAALLVATVPLWMVVFDAAFGTRTRPPPAVLAGVALGLVGVFILASPGFGNPGGALPTLAVLGAAMSWAAGSVRARFAPLPADPLVGTAMQMLAGGAVLAAIGVAGGEVGRVSAESVATASLVAFGWLVVAGSLVAFSAYIYALHTLPTSTVATYAYVNPVVAVLLGSLVLDESLDARTILGGAIVVLAVAVTIARRHRTPAA